MRTTALLIVLMTLLSTAAWADESDLVWSTFLGGSSSDYAAGIVLDVFGNVYVTGWTHSSNFPTTAGAFDPTYNNLWDVFVVKLNAAGSAVDYATYLGGSQWEKSHAITLDSDENVYVIGITESADFPITTGAFDTTFNDLWDVFVIKLNSTGSILNYATFLGGNGDDGDWSLYSKASIAVDSSGNAYITGKTKSTDFPTTAGAFDPTHNGGWDVFVAKLNASGSAFEYSTFLGGSGNDEVGCIVLDDSGSAYVVGGTYSVWNFPTTPGAFDPTHNGNYDVFVTKLNTQGSGLDYSTLVGGSQDDIGYGIALDDHAFAHITGSTSGFGFPSTSEAFDPTHNGGEDVFVAKFDPTGSTLIFSTFLGGSSHESGWAIVLDSYGDIYVTGGTWGADFPVTAGAFDTTFNGEQDVFVTKLKPTGNSLKYSTYLGGSGNEEGYGIALDVYACSHVTGTIWGADFPVTAGAFDTTRNGFVDGFVTKLNLGGTPVPVALVRFQATGSQGCITLNWSTVTEINCHKWEIHRSEREYGGYEQIGELSGYGSTEAKHTYRWVDRQISPGTRCFYKLKQVDFDGSFFWSHVVSATPGPTMPKSYSLSQNYPNPFNARTEFRYQIPADDRVTLKIFNTLGQEVRTLVDTQHEAGEYQVRWDGRDDHGYEVSAGIYFCTMKAGEFIQTRKMVLLR